jgi:hypothetical protein
LAKREGDRVGDSYTYCISFYSSLEFVAFGSSVFLRAELLREYPNARKQNQTHMYQ